MYSENSLGATCLTPKFKHFKFYVAMDNLWSISKQFIDEHSSVKLNWIANENDSFTV